MTKTRKSKEMTMKEAFESLIAAICSIVISIPGAVYIIISVLFSDPMRFKDVKAVGCLIFLGVSAIYILKNGVEMIRESINNIAKLYKEQHSKKC